MAGVGLPAGCYLQNAQGQFITCAGTVTSTKILRPTTPELAQEVGCPETVFAAHDGAYFSRLYLPQVRRAAPTTNFKIMSMRMKRI